MKDNFSGMRTTIIECRQLLLIENNCDRIKTTVIG